MIGLGSDENGVGATDLCTGTIRKGRDPKKWKFFMTFVIKGRGLECH